MRSSSEFSVEMVGGWKVLTMNRAEELEAIVGSERRRGSNGSGGGSPR
jgi:hypothetical protein